VSYAIIHFRSGRKLILNINDDGKAEMRKIVGNKHIDVRNCFFDIVIPETNNIDFIELKNHWWECLW